MIRPTLRSIAVTAALAAGLSAPTTAHAAPLLEAATFSGTFSSTCDLPIGLEGPEDGDYSCDHRATSVGCAAVVDTGTVTSYVKVCRADLTSGKTVGSASVVWPPYEVWTCENGAGTGMFRYQPSTAESAVFTFPVNLSVTGHNVIVTGSYTQAGTGRHIVVRAQFPAVCVYQTTGGDYAGTVTPI